MKQFKEQLMFAWLWGQARPFVSVCCRGVHTGPIGNVTLLMPPYCTSAKQVKYIVTALAESIGEMLGKV